MILAGLRPGALETIPARDVLDVMFVILAEQARADDHLLIMLGQGEMANRKSALDSTLGMTLDDFFLPEEEELDHDEVLADVYQLKTSVEFLNTTWGGGGG